MTVRARFGGFGRPAADFGYIDGVVNRPETGGLQALPFGELSRDAVGNTDYGMRLGIVPIYQNPTQVPYQAS